eukprot:gene3237-3751_t
MPYTAVGPCPVSEPCLSGKGVSAVSAGRHGVLVLTRAGLFHMGMGVCRNHTFDLDPRRYAATITNELGLSLSFAAQSTNGLPSIDTFNDMPVTSISCGAHHYLAEMRSTRLAEAPKGPAAVCLFGDISPEIHAGAMRTAGELGHPEAEDVVEPKRVSFFVGKQVARVAAGVSTSLVVTTDHSLYAFGDAFAGRLGVGDLGDNLTAFYTTPQRLGYFDEFVRGS